MLHAKATDCRFSVKESRKHHRAVPTPRAAPSSTKRRRSYGPRGAFLITASWDAAKQATASPVTVVSEAGQEFVLTHPWGNRSVEVRSNETAAVHVTVEGGRLRFRTKAGRTYEIATSQ